MTPDNYFLLISTHINVQQNKLFQLHTSLTTPTPPLPHVLNLSSWDIIILTSELFVKMQGYTCNTDMHVTTFFSKRHVCFLASVSNLQGVQASNQCTNFQKNPCSHLLEHAWTKSCPQTGVWQTKGQTDRRTGWNKDPPPNFVCGGGGYNYIHVDILDVDIIIIMWT